MSAVVGDLAALDWCRYLIDKKIYPQVITYEFGAEITPPPDMLGIVLSGVIEICEEHRLSDSLPKAKDYLAYRPVRIMERGEYFNDFEAVDRATGLDKPAIGYGEKWRIYAGGHSIIVRSNIEKSRDFVLNGLVQPDIFLKRQTTDTTKVAYISYDRDLFEGENPFRDEIFRQSWHKVAAYRTGLNTYSISLLSKFRKISMSAWSALEDTEKWRPKVSVNKSNDKQIKVQHRAVANSAKTTIHTIFSDALLDALWRPIRKDPVFSPWIGKLSSDIVTELPSNFSEKNLLVARKVDRCTGSFYYPIDLHNLEINQHCSGPTTVSPAMSALRVERNSSASTGEGSAEPGDEGQRAMDFYRDLANECIDRYLGELGAAYPFSVKCINCECLVGRMLLLEFQKKRPLH